MKNKTRKKFQSITKVLAIGLMVGNLFMLASYVFLVDASVMNASKNVTIKRDSNSISMELTELEQAYLSLVSKLDLEYAESMGLYVPSVTSYAVLGGGSEESLVSYLGHGKTNTR